MCKKKKKLGTYNQKTGVRILPSAPKTGPFHEVSNLLTSLSPLFPLSKLFLSYLGPYYFLASRNLVG